jgi:hypothetical protein
MSKELIKPSQKLNNETKKIDKMGTYTIFKTLFRAEGGKTHL